MDALFGEILERPTSSVQKVAVAFQCHSGKHRQTHSGLRGTQTSRDVVSLHSHFLRMTWTHVATVVARRKSEGQNLCTARIYGIDCPQGHSLKSFTRDGPDSHQCIHTRTRLCHDTWVCLNQKILWLIWLIIISFHQNCDRLGIKSALFLENPHVMV